MSSSLQSRATLHIACTKLQPTSERNIINPPKRTSIVRATRVVACVPRMRNFDLESEVQPRNGLHQWRSNVTRRSLSCKSNAAGDDAETFAGESPGSGMPDDKLTGTALKDLIVGKWDRMHQVTINRIREGIPLINAKYFFCLEIDWHYVNQLGFEMTEEEYDKEMKNVAMCINAFDLSAAEVSDLINNEEKQPGTGASGSNKGFNVVRIKLPVDAEGF